MDIHSENDSNDVPRNPAAKETTARVSQMLSLNQYKPVHAKTMLLKFRKFMFVRHPLIRLATVHHRIFVNDDMASEDNAVKYGRIIIRKFRSNPSKESLRTGRNVTFLEFVQYIINLWENGVTLDFNWKPIYDLCLPCSIAYDFVGHSEYINKDLNTLFQSFAQTPLEDFGRLKFPFYLNNTREIYSHISKSDVMKLTKIYEMDFLMYNYSYRDIY